MGESQPPDRKEFVSRIGTFFLLIGVGALVFFFLSNAAKDPRLSYFCWGTILLTVGFIFRGQFKRPAPPPSGRFSVLKKLKLPSLPKPKKEEKKK